MAASLRWIRAYEARPGLPALSARPGMIDAGRYHICAVTDAGGMACWGSGAFGPPRVASGIRQISTGVTHTCALQTDGKVECWGGGGNFHGQSGVDFVNSTFSAVTAGYDHTCGILDDQSGQTAGSLRCWGSNEFDQAVLPPALIGATFAAISAGTVHTCGILDGQNTQTAGLLRCWGNPPGADNVDQAVVPASLAANTFTKLASGFYHNCGTLDEQNGQEKRTLRCWGRNNEVSSEQAVVPVDLADTDFVDVAVGRVHTCGVTRAGRVVCWWNKAGTKWSAGQVIVPEQYRYSRFAAVAASTYHTCAVTAEGKAACWGGGDGRPNVAGVQVITADGRILNSGQTDPQPPAPATARPTVTLVLSNPESTEWTRMDGVRTVAGG